LERRLESRVSGFQHVVVHGTDSSGTPFTAPAEAVNSSHSGTCLRGLHVELVRGARIEVESAGRKVPYLVEWIGAEYTSQQGQIGARRLDLNVEPHVVSGSYEHSGAQTPAAEQAALEERRRFPRKACRIETQVTTEDEFVRLQGTVTDISLDGCYVEMMSPLPAGTIIHISLGMDGGAITTTGIIRSSQIGLGMGVEFMAMSPEEFEKLRSFAPPGATPPGQKTADGHKSKQQQPVLAANTPAEKESRFGAAMPCEEMADLRDAASHLPSTAEALEAVIRVLSKKGLITHEELCQELGALKNARH
jgi:hypothetical protein